MSLRLRTFRNSWSTFAVVLALLVSACATARPGEDLVLLKAEDIRIQSRVLYDHVMSWHDSHSTEETPAVYQALEKVRKAFPTVHKPYVDTLKSYKAAQARDPEALRASVLRFLADIEALGDESWKEKVRFLRATFQGV